MSFPCVQPSESLFVFSDWLVWVTSRRNTRGCKFSYTRASCQANRNIISCTQCHVRCSLQSSLCPYYLHRHHHQSTSLSSSMSEYVCVYIGTAQVGTMYIYNGILLETICLFDLGFSSSRPYSMWLFFFFFPGCLWSLCFSSFFFSYFWLPLPSSHQEHARMYSRYNILDSLLNLSSFLLLRGPFTSLLLFMYIFHLFFFNGTKHFLFIRRCHRDRVYRHRDRRQDAGKRKLEKRERERERERENISKSGECQVR